VDHSRPVKGLIYLYLLHVNLNYYRSLKISTNSKFTFAMPVKKHTGSVRYDEGFRGCSITSEDAVSPVRMTVKPDGGRNMEPSGCHINYIFQQNLIFIAHFYYTH
jgi:hypothetical protein